jgi:hypothetical protein
MTENSVANRRSRRRVAASPRRPRNPTIGLPMVTSLVMAHLGRQGQASTTDVVVPLGHQSREDACVGAQRHCHSMPAMMNAWLVVL